MVTGKTMKHSIKFLPLLMIYIMIVLVAHTDTFWGDESRYLMYSKNLLNGHYSPQNIIYLWNGPGYPIILIPFVKFNLPLLAAKLLNPLFLFGAILYFFHTLRFYMKDKSAIFFSYLLGIYPPFCRYIHFLLTEQVAIFLICGFSFHFSKLCRKESISWFQIFISSLYLGYLALTKVFFGYVILVGLLLCLFLYICQRKTVLIKTSFVYSLALLVCIPYLIYTYSLTGKIFYWGNSGGISLYVMSTPYEDELGGLRMFNVIESSNHKEFFDALDKRNLSGIEWDIELKKQAINNIINNPAKYFENWIANVGRLLFNYPYAYEYQKLSTYFYLIPNIFLVVFCILCLYPSYMRSVLIPSEIYGLGMFALIYFGGSSIIYAESRYFSLLVPILMLWISYTLTRLVNIDILHDSSYRKAVL